MKMKWFTVVLGAALMLFQLPSIAAAKDPEISAASYEFAPIAGLAATGDIPALKQALNKGLDDGLEINPIKEILVQVYAYAGFPRSLNALAAFSQVLKAREAKGIHDPMGPEAKALPIEKSLEVGTKIQTQVVGRPVEGGLMDFAPAIDQYLKAHLFGDIFARDNISFQEREIATVGMLATMSGTESQLNSHFNIAMNTGLTEAQLRQTIDALKSEVSADVAAKANQQLDAFLKK